MRPKSTIEPAWRVVAWGLWPAPMTLDGSVSVRVNGEHKRLQGAITIAQMLNELGLDPLRVAVERNLEIVPRATLGQVCVEDGDDFEIVQFVGGG